MGVSQNQGYLFGVPNDKDYSIFGATLGSPYFGKLPYEGLDETMLGPHSGFWRGLLRRMHHMTYMIYSLNSLKGGIYRGLYGGLP